MERKVVDRYSTGSKWLHWIVALIIIILLPISFFLSDFPKEMQPLAYMIHKSLGLTVLVLMLLRLLWIVHTGRPELPFSVPRWEKILSLIVQNSLYVFLILMPLSGWIMSISADRTPVYFGLFEVPLFGIPVDKSLSELFAKIHEIIAYILATLVTLHLLGALKHDLIDKDKIMHRMLGDARKDR